MKYKKFFILGTIAIASIVLAVFGIVTSLGNVGMDGYMVPSTNTITLNLKAGNHIVEEAYEVNAEDELFVRNGQYLVGEDRVAVDVTFPEYIYNGTGLKFLTDNIYLITDDLYPYQTYDGLYMSEGITFNEDHYLADREEFILVQLTNGLYIIAQDGQFKNSEGTYNIPMNSILYMDNEVIRWYSFKTNGFIISEVEAVNAAKITIGDDEYAYADLLDALGILKKATKKIDDSKDPTEEIEKAQKAIEGSHVEHGNKQTKKIDDIIGKGGQDTKSNKTDKTNDEDTAEENNPNKDKSKDGQDSDKDQKTEDNRGTGETKSEGKVKKDDSGLDDSGNDDDDQEGEFDLEGYEYEYYAPEVTLEKLEVWGYCINVKIDIYDPGNNIPRGVTVVVYKSVKGNLVKVDSFNGFKQYSSQSLTGKSTALRTTITKSKEFVMSVLTPNTKYYVQLQYRYDTWGGEYRLGYDENGTLISKSPIMTRNYYYSNFIEFSTLSFQKSNLQTVALTFTPQYAAYSNAMQFTGMSLKNTSNYDSTSTTFSNFKLNTLPYLNRIVFTLVPEDGSETIKVTATSSTVSKAKNSQGIVYKSTNNLKANKVYRTTLVAYDKTGNIIPLSIDGVDYRDYSFKVYTSKNKPKIVITEVENISDSLTIDVTVSDADNTLLSTDGISHEPICLTFTDTSNKKATLNGTVDGVVYNENKTEINLSNPSHGKTYRIQLDSLAFSRAYVVQVTGSYNLTPDASLIEYQKYKEAHNEVISVPIISGKISKATSKTVIDGINILDDVNDVSVGTYRIYTAAITQGNMFLNSSVTELKDTYATLEFAFNNRSTQELIPMLDALRIVVTETDTEKVVTTVELKRDDLLAAIDSEKYKYNALSAGVVVYDGGVTQPTVVFTGTRDVLVSGATVWDSIFPTIVQYDDEGNPIYRTPAVIKFIMPEGLLKTDTVYDFEMRSIVIKGEDEYQIPTSITTSSFTSKKIQPKIHKSSLFITGDEIRFLDFWIEDVDSTIDNADVTINLYYGEDLIGTRTWKANSTAQDLYFNDLISGEDYVIKFIANRFNDTRRSANVVVDQEIGKVTFKGSEYLAGSITLLSSSSGSSFNGIEFAHYSKQSILDDIDGKTTVKMWNQYGSYVNAYMSDYINVPTGATAIKLTGIATTYPSSGNKLQYNYIYFYDDAGNRVYLTYNNVNNNNDYLNGTISGFYSPELSVLVPENAKKFKIIMITPTDISSDGLRLGYFTELGKNIIFDSENSSYQRNNCYPNSSGGLSSSSSYCAGYMIPVQPGDLYLATGRVYSIYSLYDKDGNFLLYANNFSYNSVIQIPDNAYYITCAVLKSGTYQSFGLYKISTASTTQYKSVVKIDVNDEKGYLREDEISKGITGKFGHVTLKLYKSTEIMIPTYPTTPTRTIDLALISDNDGTYSLSTTQLFDQLDLNCIYRVDLIAEYLGKTITLDTRTIITDNDYIIIRTEQEMYWLTHNPYGHFIVENDIEVGNRTSSYIANFSGTLDFNGHIITANNIQSAQFIDYLNREGVVKNFVYDVNYEGNIGRSICAYLHGTMTNCIYRLNQPTSSNTSSYLICVTLESTGILEKVIVQINKDITLKTNVSDNAGHVHYLMGSVNGIFKDSYIYGNNGAGVIYYTDRKVSTTSQIGLIGATNIVSEICNIFTSFPSWHGKDTDSAILTYQTFGKIHDWYHVGDFYEYNGIKSYQGVVSTNRMTNPKSTFNPNYAHIYKSIYNLWSLSDNEYQYNGNQSTKVITFANTDLIADLNWQQSILKNGDFEIKKNIDLGYYPRLNLNECMKRHQQYVSLGLIPQEMPEIISDDFAKNSQVDIIKTTYSLKEDDNAYIIIRFKNDANATIHNIQFDTLQTENDINGNQIIYQAFAPDGLYDVVVKAYANNDSGYLSEYTITGFDYSTRSAVLTSTQTYTTQKVSFWKEVTDDAGWRDINLHMNWNYHLNPTTTLDLSNLTTAATMLNGNILNDSSGTYFKGNIDGMKSDGTLTTITGISIRGNYPYVIYGVDQGATIKNLVVDGMVITGSTVQSSDVAGFIGRCANNTKYTEMIDNVHIRNSTITAAGSVGGILGHGRCWIQNCSIANSNIYASKAAKSTYLGGLVGQSDEGSNPHAIIIKNSYVYKCTIDSSNNIYVKGTCGVIGWNGNSSVMNCYILASKIKAQMGVVGGFTNKISSGRIIRCISDVDIDCQTPAGGFVYEGTAVQNCFVAGDIVSTSTYAHRINSTTSKFTSVYGYERQIVNAIKDADNCQSLLSGQLMALKSTWTDLILLGTDYNYSNVPEGYYPQLLNTDGTLLYGQTLAAMPGQGHEMYAELTSASIQGDISDRVYYIEILLTHPGVTTAQAQALTTISCEGLDISEGNIESNKAMVSWSPAIKETGESASNIIIWSKTLLKALDMYKIIMEINNPGETTQLSVVANFGTPIYWEIPNINTWNDKVANHGNNENFKITGLIDFSNQDTQYKDLVFNRLISDDPNGSCGFANMTFVVDKNDPKMWITNITTIITNIKITNFNLDLTPAKVYSNYNGIIAIASEFKNVIFEDIEIVANYFTGNYLGMFGYVDKASDIGKATNIKITVESGASETSYIGAFVGNKYQNISNVIIDDAHIKLSKGGYIGFVCGYCRYYCNNNTVKNSDIEQTTLSNSTGRVGGVVGHAYGHCTGNTVENIEIKYTGGLVGGVAGWTYALQDNNVYNVKLSSTETGKSASFGGLAGQFGQSGYTYNNVVKKVEINDAYKCGGLAGGIYQGSAYNNIVYNVRLNNVKMAAGGFVGSYESSTVQDFYSNVIRDVIITTQENSLEKYFGGFIGYSINSAAKFYNNYVAEDVILNIKGNARVGGFIGDMDVYTIYDCIVGTKITVEGQTDFEKIYSCGGLIGYVDYSVYGPTTSRTIKNTIIACEVSGIDYVSGVIGYADTAAKFEKTDYSNVLFTGNITSSSTNGEHVSLWMNSKGVISASDAYILAFEGSYINNEMVKSIQTANAAKGAVSDLLPKSLVTYSADQLKEESFYKTLLATNLKYWSTEHMYHTVTSGGETTVIGEDNIYFPYSATNKVPNAFTNKDGNNNTVGILLPEKVEIPTTYVYASSVETINIETNLPTVSVKFGNGETQSYTINDAYGDGDDKMYVLTLEYYFMDDIEVDGVVYQASSLRNTISTDKNMSGYWYFIHNDNVYYGTRNGLGGVYADVNAAENLPLSIVTGSENAIHIWNQTILYSDNKVSQVITSVNTTRFEILYAQGAVRPIERVEYAQITNSVGATIDVEVFNSFSIVDGIKVNARVYKLGNKIYTVSPQQFMKADNYILSSTNTASGNRVYFATLDSYNRILNLKYICSFPVTSAGPTNIVEIKDARVEYDPYTILRYADGHVEVINVYNGAQIFTSANNISTFGTYIKSKIDQAILALAGYDSEVDDSLEIAENLASLIENDSEYDITSGIDDIVKSADSWYVPGEGLFVGGKLACSADDATYVEGEGVYINGVLAVSENGSGKEAEGKFVFNDKEIKTVAKTTKENVKLMVLGSLGNTIIKYDESSGQYIVTSMKDIVDISEGNYEGNADELHNELLKKAEKLISEGKLDGEKFKIKYSGTHTVTQTEKNGTILYVSVSMMAVVVLVIIYIAYIKKKQRLSK